MKTKLVVSLACALLALACRGNDGKAVRKDQQYDVVQEGQASGVTSTINGPGEAAPVASAPLTGTNADTTTNLALPTDAAGNVTQGQPGTLASTLPATSGAMGTPSTPPAGAPPRPRVTSNQQPAPQPMTSASTAAPTPHATPQPTRRVPASSQPRTEPATDTQPTDTTATEAPTTETKPPRESGTKSDDKPEKTDTSTSTPPATDTQPPPPPPPNA